MKYLFLCLLAYFLLSTTPELQGQTITFGIADKRPTDDGSGVVFDVTLQSTSPFKVGSGLLYFNYNTAAFGPNVVANDRVTISYPDGSVLGQTVGFPVYRSFIRNDNTERRFAFSFQQGVSAGSIPADNIPGPPVVLFRVTLDFIPGGEGQPDDICFESSEIFDDQFFTACGPDGPGFADCFNFPGTQLTDDVFDCTSAALPVELLSFTATPNGKQVQLRWHTANERDNDFFTVERSADGAAFTPIATVAGAGTTTVEQWYESWDEQPQRGLNYYRLQQVDFDGTFTYSPIRQVNLESTATAADIQVFPNPTSSFLRIDFAQALTEDSQVHLCDPQGRIIQTYTIKAGVPQHQLNLAGLPKGTYFLQIHTMQYSTAKRVVLQ